MPWSFIVRKDGGEVSTFGYDNRNRTTSVSHATSSGTVLESESYSYDSAGNLSSKTVGSTTTDYTYDNANQLLSEINSGYSASYTYDANGNRTSKTLGGVTDTYTVDSGDKLTSTSTKSYTYDGDGRTKTVTSSGATTTLSYDYEGRVTSIANPGGSTYTYSYNGVDARIGKNEGSAQSYRRDGVGVTSPVLSDGVSHFTPGVSQHTTATTFNHADQLGSYVAQSNFGQTLTATQTFDAFGLLVSSTGTPAGPFGFAGDAGYQTDASGLMLLGHRYNDASTGRFITRDPALDGRNWYVYCESNRLTLRDETGLDDGDHGLHVPKLTLPDPNPRLDPGRPIAPTPPGVHIPPTYDPPKGIKGGHRRPISVKVSLPRVRGESHWPFVSATPKGFGVVVTIRG